MNKTKTPKASILTYVQHADNALSKLLSIAPADLNWSAEEFHEVFVLQSRLRVKQEMLKHELRDALELRPEEVQALTDIFYGTNVKHSKAGRKPRPIEELSRRDFVRDSNAPSLKHTNFVVTQRGEDILKLLGVIDGEVSQMLLL